MSNTPRIDRIDKNYIINGACEYFQESGGSAIAVPSSYDYVSMDMFETEVSGTWTTPQSSRSTTKVGTRSRRSHLFTGTPTNVADEFHMKTKIESILAMELLDDVFSLGLKLRSDNFTQVRVILSYADAEDNFSAVTQIIEQTIDFTADGSIQEVKFENISPNANIVNGLQVEFEFKGLGGLTATNLYVGEFVLNKGKTKNDYSPCGRDQIEELLLCQRYFEKSYELDTAPGTANGDGAARIQVDAGSDISYFSVKFSTRKRAVPTITPYSSVTGTAARVRTGAGDTASYAITDLGSSSFSMQSTVPDQLLIFQWTADARL